VTAAEDPQVKPSPAPRPKPAVTQKSASERITGVPDKPARKRGRSVEVEFLGLAWRRDAASPPEIGWSLAHQCAADPTFLEQLKVQHATQPDPQVELDAYLVVEPVSE